VSTVLGRAATSLATHALPPLTFAPAARICEAGLRYSDDRGRNVMGDRRGLGDRVRGWLVVAVAAATGCGRIAFDPLTGAADASDGGPLPDLPCNTPLNVGSISELFVTTTGNRWIAASGGDDRLVVSYLTTGGVTAVTIDLRATPPQRGPEVMVAGAVRGNTHAAVTGDRVVFSAEATNGRADIAVTDLALAPIAARIEPAADPSAPDHSSPRPGGGVVIAGSQSGSNLAQVVALDRDGGFVGSMSWTLPMAAGGTVATLPTGGYAVAYYDGNGLCELKRLDDTLAEVGRDAITACDFLRVAAVDAGRIALVWHDATTPMATMADLALVRAPAVPLAASSSQSPRMAATGDGSWTVFPTNASSLVAVHLNPSGQPSSPVPLAPYAGGGGQFISDVAIAGGRAYAVWADQLTASSLYIAQLCRP
jgi:hypothetical protein